MADIITRESTQSFANVCAKLPDIATKHKFGVLGVHDLKEKLNSKGVPFARDCRVFEVCNPQQASLILGQSIAVSSALPCRISAYQENGKTVLATIKPSALLHLYGGTAGQEIAREVETSLVRIMDEACA